MPREIAPVLGDQPQPCHRHQRGREAVVDKPGQRPQPEREQQQQAEVPVVPARPEKVHARPELMPFDPKPQLPPAAQPAHSKPSPCPRTEIRVRRAALLMIKLPIPCTHRPDATQSGEVPRRSQEAGCELVMLNRAKAPPGSARSAATLPTEMRATSLRAVALAEVGPTGAAAAGLVERDRQPACASELTVTVWRSNALSSRAVRA